MTGIQLGHMTSDLVVLGFLTERLGDATTIKLSWKTRRILITDRDS
jgi:hypothetical protein